MKSKKIIYAILLVLWMITTFWFSAQPSDESSGTSGNTIRAIINLIPSIREMDETEREKIVETLQPYARKIAHFISYTIGGILLFLNANQYYLSEDKKGLIAFIIGALYSITDEAHQILVPGRSRRNSRRCYRFVRNCAGNCSNMDAC